MITRFILSMLSVEPCLLPDKSLLKRYANGLAYTDCYCVEIPRKITLPQYVNAFYTTPIFKLERVILKWALSKPSSDDQARQLAHAETNRFAAWHMEERGENQLLMSDFQGRTRSWFMVSFINTGPTIRTQLCFGSAVIKANKKANPVNMNPGLAFRVLMVFHKLYSKVLLSSARLRLIRQLSA